MVIRVPCRDCRAEGRVYEVRRPGPSHYKTALAERNRIERELEDAHERGEHDGIETTEALSRVEI